MTLSKRSKTHKKKFKGGFYPSVMRGVITVGGILIPLAFRHGVRLLNSKRGVRKTRKAQPKV